MTDDPKPTITPEEMQRRRAHVRTAIADDRIEGIATSAIWGHLRKRKILHVSAVRDVESIGLSPVQKPKHGRCFAPDLLNHSFAPCFW